MSLTIDNFKLKIYMKLKIKKEPHRKCGVRVIRKLLHSQLSSTNCHHKDHLISKPMLKAKSKPHSRNTKSQTISTVRTSKENQKKEKPLWGEREWVLAICLWLAVVAGNSHGVCKAWSWLGFHEICCKLHLLLISESKEPISICIQMFQWCISISKVKLVWFFMFSCW